MTWLDALILGIIQGLTEFLPVSSSGHLEIGGILLGLKSENNLLFAVVVHAATSLSTLVVFRKDIVEIIKGVFSRTWNSAHDFTLKILISMVPVGIIGIFFEDQIASFFTGNLLLVGSMLCVTSLLLFITYFSRKNEGEVTYTKAIIIGFAQAIAILPGISRSGATIATGIMLGVDKSQATRFSFLMVIIPILGAGFLKYMSYLKDPVAAGSISSTVLLVGFVAAFFAGFLACKWMINLVRKGKLTWFAAYCGVVGLVAVILA